MRTYQNIYSVISRIATKVCEHGTNFRAGFEFRMSHGILFGTLLAFTACEEFIDEPKPKATISIAEIGNSTAGLDAALTGAWAWWTAPQVFVGHAMVYPEALADYLEFTYASTGRGLNEPYQRNFENVTYSMIGEFGQRASRAENLAALVVAAARADQPTDEDWESNRDRILGEGLFLRSWIHFEYIKMNADQWITKDPSANANALGPLIHFKPILSLEDLALARTPLAAAYDSTINSLLKAEQLLPEFYDPSRHAAAFQVRASRGAASALLAKVYWQQNDFDNTLVQINKVIGSTPGASNHPLADNFDDVYGRKGITNTTNAENKGEVILEYVARDPAKISTRNGQALSNAWWRNGRTALYFGKYFQNLADFDTDNDRRYQELFNKQFTQNRVEVITAADSAWTTRKFVESANTPIIRSAELLLMRAEIFARKGQLQNALKDLNYVRERAGLEPITATEGLVDTIITERIREMHAEGYRSHELKRLGSLTDGDPDEVFFLPGGRSGAADCGYPGACDPIKWNSRMLIWPITQSELNINPLAQNP